MMSVKKIKEMAKENEKKISKMAIKKINLILEEKARLLIKKAILNSDFKGRIIIKEEDIE